MVTTARTPAKTKTSTALEAANLLKAQAEAAKANAEAELALAAAEEKRAAARAHDAEIVRGYADEELTRLMIKHSETENAVAEIQRAKIEREESFARVSDLFNHTYTFDDPIVDVSVKICINTLTAWARQVGPDEHLDITLYINSPGGSVPAGFTLVDFLSDLRRQGHKITTVGLGWVASMGVVLLQTGDVRVMGKYALLLLHETTSSFEKDTTQSASQQEDNLKLINKMSGNVWDMLASRAMPLNPKTTATFLKRLSKRSDVGMTSAEALELGLVDEVR